MHAWYEIKVRSELEAIFKTKANSLNIDSGESIPLKPPEDNLSPKAAPRKSSSKNHRAPPAPSTSTSVSSGTKSPKDSNDYLANNSSGDSNKARYIPNKISKTKPSMEKTNQHPQTSHSARSSADKKGKLDIRISNIENSDTDYSTIQREK